MLKINISAKKLHEIEKKLNQIHFKDFEIGSTLSFYFDRLYRGDFDNRFFRSFFNFNIFYNHNKRAQLIMCFHTNK